MQNNECEQKSLAKEINVQAEKMDKEVINEKKKNVTEVVSRTKRKVTTKGFDNATPVSNYMEAVQKKRKRNKERIESLGLAKTSRSPPKAKRKLMNSKKTVQQSPKKTTKVSPKKKIIPCKKSSQTKRKRVTRKIFETAKNLKDLKCTHDHMDVSAYKEEGDRRYFKDKDSELFGTSCALCFVNFKFEAGKNAVDINNPTHFCFGRQKFGCRHGYCHTCYVTLVNKSSTGRSRRTKSEKLK